MTGRSQHARALLEGGHRLDLGDYPLEIDSAALELISDQIREFAPDVLLTHTGTDPFNPDHPVAHAAVARARGLAAGAGVQSAFATVKPPELFLFEPHLQTYYAQRADHRGNHARRSSGNAEVRQAEAFQRVTPQVVRAL